MLIFPLLAFVSLVLSQESVSITTSISLITITAAPSTTPTGAPPALIGYSTETDIGAYIPWYCDQGQIWSQDGNYARCCDSDPSVECPIGISCLNTSLIVGPNSQQTWSCTGTGTQTTCVTGFIYPSIGATRPETNVACWPTWNGGNWTATRNISTSTSSPSASALSTSKGGAKKIRIGVGIALMVVLLAVGLGWFIVMHRRKVRRENNNGSSPEHATTIHEKDHTSKTLEEPSLTPVPTLQEMGGSEVQTWNELPISSSTATKTHELQDSATSPQSIELGTGAENRPRESLSPASRSQIQQNPVSPGHSSFPPPWDTSLQQGNNEQREQSGIGQSQETRNTRADEMVVEPDDQDPELLRLEEEMARIEAEERRLQLDDLRRRKKVLEKTIEERRKGSIGASNN